MRVEGGGGGGEPTVAAPVDRHADAELLADVAHVERGKEIVALLLDAFAGKLRVGALG